MGFLEDFIARAMEAHQRAQAPPQAIPVAPPRKKKKKRRAEAADAVPMAELPETATRRIVEDTAVPVSTEPQPLTAGHPDLRRLFVLAEVLGPPLALREDGDALGPV